MEFQEPLEGKIIVKSSSSISHYGVRLTVNGSVNLQVGLNQSSVWFPRKKMTENIVFKRDSYFFFPLFLSNQTELFLFSFLYHSKISTEMLLFVWRFVEDRLELLSPYMVLSSLSPFCKFNLWEALILQSSYFETITQLYLSVYVNSGSYIMCNCGFCVYFWSM